MKIQTQEEPQKIKESYNKTSEAKEEEMEIGDLDLVGMETSCSEKIPEKILPLQVKLLEKAIIKAKSMKFLGVSSESLKDSDGKNKGKKENRRRHSNVQRIKVVGDQLVASRKYPTIDASLSPVNK